MDIINLISVESYHESTSTRIANGGLVAKKHHWEMHTFWRPFIVAEVFNRVRGLIQSFRKIHYRYFIKDSFTPSSLFLSLVLIFPKHVLFIISIFSFNLPQIRPNPLPSPIFIELKIADFSETLDYTPNKILIWLDVISIPSIVISLQSITAVINRMLMQINQCFVRYSTKSTLVKGRSGGSTCRRSIRPSI